mmetsp:Transcript_17736/g.35799  ORF Transcript_17736/g.35799 Transcript_17736/m.35799 type:complete len:343 (+) Transcript_17736:119-1147(+)
MAIHIRRTLGHSALSTREEESTTSNYAVIHRELFAFPPRNATTGNLFDYSHPSKSSISTSSSRDGEEKIFVLNHLNDGVNTSYGSRNHVFGKSYNGDEQINNSPDPMLCIVIILLMGIFFHLTFTLMLNGRLDRKSCLPSFICRGSPDDEEDANNANNNDSIQPTQADEESAVAISNDRDNDQLQKIQKERATFVDDALITTTFASIMRNSTSKTGDNNSEVSLEGFVTSVRSEASLSSSSSGSADSFVPGSSSESVFHTDCIVSWLVDQKRDDCPYCRGRYILQFGDRGGDDCRNVVRHDNVGGNYVVNGFSGAREDFGFSPNTARDEDTVNVELSHIDVG